MLEKRNVHGLNDFFYDWDLNHQVLWHGFAVSLVVLEGLVPYGRTLNIKNYSKVGRLFFFDELFERTDESEYGVGRKPF